MAAPYTEKELLKGQLISEWLFGVFNFQKNKLKWIDEFLP